MDNKRYRAEDQSSADVNGGGNGGASGGSGDGEGAACNCNCTILEETVLSHLENMHAKIQRLEAENRSLKWNQEQIHAEVGRQSIDIRQLKLEAQLSEQERRRVTFMGDVLRIIIQGQTFIVSIQTMCVAEPSKLWSDVDHAVQVKQAVHYPERSPEVFGQILEWLHHLAKNAAIVRADEKFKMFIANASNLNELREYVGAPPGTAPPGTAPRGSLQAGRSTGVSQILFMLTYAQYWYWFYGAFQRYGLESLFCGAAAVAGAASGAASGAALGAGAAAASGAAVAGAASGAAVEMAEVEVSNPVAQNQFYVIAGHVGGSEGYQLDTINVYNPETRVWTQPLPPLPRCTHDHAAAIVEGVLFVVGGRTETGGELESGYKLSADNQWEDIPCMREPRFGHCCLALDGMLYALGGWHEEKLKSCERFDPVHRSWDSISGMKHSRCGSAGVVLGGKIYMIGGWSAASREAERIEDMKKMEVYDPHTDTWQDGPMMTKGREGMSSVVHDGKIYIVGGVDSNEEPLRSIEFFDPATQLWHTLQVQLPDAHGRGLGGCVSIKGKIYIAGGFIGDKVAASGWEFDPTTALFMPIQHLPSAAERFAVVGT